MNSVNIYDLLTIDNSEPLSKHDINKKTEPYYQSQYLSNIDLHETDSSKMDPSKMNMQTLRQNYSTLLKHDRSFFTRDIMGKMWDSWQKNTPVFPGIYNIKLGQIRTFILNPDQIELIVHQRTSRSRFEYHTICNALKLEHKSMEREETSNTIPKKDIDTSNTIPKKDINDSEGWNIVKNHKKKKEDKKSHFIIDRKNPVMTSYELYKNNQQNNSTLISSTSSTSSSSIINNNVKTLIISKPKNWCWEFTQMSLEQINYNNDKLKKISNKQN
jgi:hypothetical protein